MHPSIKLLRTKYFKSTQVDIPGSKSESNRALIISALEGNTGRIDNLASARDTTTMQTLLLDSGIEQDVLDAGTTMRFLTAYYAVSSKHKILTGTERMQERPIKILVEALKELGCTINYKGIAGYPPLETLGLQKQQTNHLLIPGNVSSQYISALLMIAPTLPSGLSLELTGDIGSRPYIQMTLDILAAFGIEYEWTGKIIRIQSQSFKKATFTVEADWSGASYWYAFATLGTHNGILLKGLRDNSLQGDREIATIMSQLGIQTTFTDQGAYLIKIESKSHVQIDFTDCPDLAQTVVVLCAAKNIRGTFTGLESLKIKETDRIQALRAELAKVNCLFTETENGVYTISSGDMPDHVEIDTYEDHRMAMAFAPLAMKLDITIRNPAVVNKSYPEFWEEVKKAGIETTLYT